MVASSINCASLILKYPSPELNIISSSVDCIDQSIYQLVENMREIMYNASGIGLAAPQINVHKRVIIVDISSSMNDPIILINPEIFWMSKELSVYKEGCLSFPGFYIEIQRSAFISVRAKNLDGFFIELKNIGGLLATCIQHEVDHLNGKLLIDHLSNLKKQRALKKMSKKEI